MSPEMRLAKLAKLVELEGFEDENALFAAAISDSVCQAICCNPAHPDCQYADSGGSRPRIRDDLAHHSDLISLGVPR